jgi:hypothetical protein
MNSNTFIANSCSSPWMTCMSSRCSAKTGASSAASLAASSTHLLIANASRGSDFLFFTQCPLWTWLLLSLPQQPKASQKAGEDACVHACHGGNLLTNKIEPSCGIQHSGTARTASGLSRGQVGQRRLSPIDRFPKCQKVRKSVDESSTLTSSKRPLMCAWGMPWFLT